MSQVRFGVSLEEQLLSELDNYVSENNFPNRSQAIRHLIENSLVEQKWNSNDKVSGAIVLLYNHHKNDVTVRSNEVQHEFYNEILSSQHFHLNHDNCLEIIAVKGEARKLNDISRKLIALKGIIHGQLIMSKMI